MTNKNKKKEEIICDYCLKPIRRGQKKRELMEEIETSKGIDYWPRLVHDICAKHFFNLH